MYDSKPILSGFSRRQREAGRGFTLIELMVVVLIIAILATIAVPSVVERLRDRRASEAAQRIAALYRGARMRAMGRGSAVMVSFNNGVFTVNEAVRPAPASNSGCTGEPSSSCVNNNWAVAANFATLSTLNIASRSEYAGVSVAANPSTVTRLDLCFTPMGRAYTRPGDVPFTPMVGVSSFTISRSSSTLLRTVSVLPNGIARVAL